MLIHLQNSYAPHGKQHTGRREVHSHEPVNSVKKNSLYICNLIFETLQELNAR
jgi:hypothetical protein